MKSLSPSVFCLLAAALGAPVSAQVLMLDFGPTAATGASLTNSPYHAANATFTGATWNTLGTADAGSGLLWASGGSAGGITVNIGATTDAASTTIGLANTPSNSNALGTTVNSGVYANTSVARDAIYTGTTGNIRAVGVQIGGLAAGTYDIYVTGRNTNISTTHVQNFYAGKSSAATDFDFSGFGTASLSFGNTSTSATSGWGAGANYVKLSVVITSGDYLDLAVRGGSGEARGFLSVVQVVNTSPVPEPASAALGAGAVVLLGATGGRRRRAA